MPLKINKKFRFLWYAWGISFVILECLAIIKSEPGDTLSEIIWDYRNHAGSFGYASIAALLLWLLYHFLREGPKH